MKIIEGLITHTVEIEIPFYDIDRFNIAWHGHYIKYFEIARCALLSTLSYDYDQMQTSGYFWPVVDLRIKYIKPAKFNQKVLVKASIVEYENRLKIQYIIVDKITSERLTKAYTIQVAVDVKTNEMCFASPKMLIDKIQQHCPTTGPIS